MKDLKSVAFVDHQPSTSSAPSRDFSQLLPASNRMRFWGKISNFRNRSHLIDSSWVEDGLSQSLDDSAINVWQKGKRPGLDRFCFSLSLSSLVSHSLFFFFLALAFWRLVSDIYFPLFSRERTEKWVWIEMNLHAFAIAEFLSLLV